MGFLATIKGNQALKLHSKGDYAGACKMYEEAIAAGMNNPRLMLSYSVLLIRMNNFTRAKELLVKTQKLPGITGEQKDQLFMNYAVCAYKLGDAGKAITLLERQYAKKHSGTMYQTLGCLYVEYCAMDKEYVPIIPQQKDDDVFFSAEEAHVMTREEFAGKVLAFNKEAVEYDDTDPICLDNLGQTYYRVLGDKVEAKKWFDLAIAEKSNQIDTLWFLSRYDVEEGKIEDAIEKLEDAAQGRPSPLNYAQPEMIKAEIARLKAL